ncbi:MAG TPA: hypothetical protein VI172_11420 [Candidatus Dormibacteraeota bacterium]|jgi:hypothetical protein
MDLPKTLPAKTAPIVRAAIKSVRDVSPEATEIPYAMAQPRSKSMMWKLVRYAVDGENVVGVGTFSQHAAMFFYRGRELDSGDVVLQGTGKDTRFISLRTVADASSAPVKRLLRQAFRRSGS